MLEDRLVIWGGEFARTVYCQGCLTETDDYSYNITKDPVRVAMPRNDHKRLTDRFQGRDFRLTDVAGEVVKPVLV